MDDSHALHIHYYANDPKLGGNPNQERIPYAWVNVRDEAGRFKVATNQNLAQDVMAWVTQGPVARRDRKSWASRTLIGIIMYRKLLKEQMQLVADGQDPINTFRDASDASFVGVPTEETPFMALPTRRVGQPLSPFVTV